MHKTIVEAYPAADISISIVWVNVLKADDEVAARKSADIFHDPRVRQFHDPNRLVARIVAADTGMPPMLSLVEKLNVTRERLEANFQADFVAGPAASFDTFMFYQPGGTWSDRLPPPHDWCTQLDPDAFLGIPRERFHFGEDLVAELRRVMAGLFGPSPVKEPDPPAAKTP